MQAFFAKVLAGFGLKITGWVAWLIQLFFFSFFEWLIKFIREQREEAKRQAEIEKIDKQLLKEYRDAIAKGGAVSREERRKIAERLLNRTP